MAQAPQRESARVPRARAGGELSSEPALRELLPVSLALLLTGAAIALTGGWTSPLMWFLVVPLTFQSVTSRGRTSAALPVIAIATAFAAGAIAGSTPPLLVATLVTVQIVATHLVVATVSAELRAQRQQARRERASADERATLLAVTAAASRGLVSLDPEQIVEHLTRSTAALGFDVAMFLVHDEGTDELECTSVVGLPDTWVGRRLPRGDGIAHRALHRDETLVVTDYGRDPDALPELREYEQVVVTPVRRDGTPTAVLGVGTRAQRPVDDVLLESLETLALHAAASLRLADAHMLQERANRELAALSELQHDFLSTASHELRTPITVVNGGLDLLSTHWDRLSEERRRQLVARCAANGEDLNRLLERLERLKALRLGQARPEREPVSARSLVVQAARVATRGRTAHPVVSRVPDGLALHADRELLEQVLVELIDNVLRHTPAGTEVHLDAHRDGAEVVVTVADDGPGIPDDDRDAVMAAFRRAGAMERRESRGIGIGLTLVVGILDLHDSEPALTSGPAGTSISFRLPLDHLPATSSQRRTAPIVADVAGSTGVERT